MIRTKTELWEHDTKPLADLEGGRGPFQGKEWEGEGASREGWEGEGEMGYNESNLQEYLPHQLGDNTPPPGTVRFIKPCRNPVYKCTGLR